MFIVRWDIIPRLHEQAWIHCINFVHLTTFCSLETQNITSQIDIQVKNSDKLLQKYLAIYIKPFYLKLIYFEIYS